MRLTLAIALALCTLPGCKKKKVEYRLDLLPADAQVVGGYDLEGLRRSPHYELLSQMKWNVSGLPSTPPCDDGSPEWSRVLAAAQPDGLTQGVVFVLEGRGAVSERRLACLRDAGVDLLDREAQKARQGGWSGIALDDDTLVLAHTTRWADAVLERLRGEGTAITEGPLHGAFKHADRSKHLWIVALPSESIEWQVRTELGYMPQYVTMTAHFSADVVVEAHIDAPRPELAEKRLEHLWPQWRAAAEMSPLPKSFWDSVSFEAMDETVRVRARLARVYMDVLDTLAAVAK